MSLLFKGEGLGRRLVSMKHLYRYNVSCSAGSSVKFSTNFHGKRCPSKLTQQKSVDSLFKKEHDFLGRHVGSGRKDVSEMLRIVACKDMEALIASTVPADIRLNRETKLPPALAEHEMLEHMKELASQNKVWRSYIGMGYYNCHVPPVISRNILENPGWITQYTPYQAEISQGRLQTLLGFQTMVSDLTGLELANASLLDESTAGAEAMGLCYRLNKRTKFLIDSKCHPQTISVIKTRADGLHIEAIVVDKNEADFSGGDISGIIVQYPDTNGSIQSMSALIHKAHSNKTLVVAACDLLSLTMLVPPGTLGCDVAVGSAQRLGIPLGFGGPHAGFFSTRKSHARSLPGRVVGITKDAQGNRAYRLALQTREQHIRRDKATSNICTAQALLANMSALYGIYHGPIGLLRIASSVNNATLLLNAGVQHAGNTQHNNLFFDTLHITTKDPVEQVKQRAEEKEINLRYHHDGTVGVSLDETVNAADIDDLLYVFGSNESASDVYERVGDNLRDTSFDNTEFLRVKKFMTHPMFNSHQSESDIVRFMKQIENKDLSMVHSMIPLGSCTMKLNPTTTLLPVSMPEFNDIHPFVPKDQVVGYHKMFTELEEQLCELTGYDKVSLQPNR